MVTFWRRSTSWLRQSFIFLWAVQQKSQRNASQVAQYAVDGLVLSHSPHTGLASFVCMTCKTCRSWVREKSVRNPAAPLSGTLCSFRHCGQMSRSVFPWVFFRIRSRHPLQNVWQHGSTLGSLNLSRHTVHVRSFVSFASPQVAIFRSQWAFPGKIRPLIGFLKRKPPHCAHITAMIACKSAKTGD